MVVFEIKSEDLLDAAAYTLFGFGCYELGKAVGHAEVYNGEDAESLEREEFLSDGESTEFELDNPAEEIVEVYVDGHHVLEGFYELSEDGSVFKIDEPIGEAEIIEVHFFPN